MKIKTYPTKEKVKYTPNSLINGEIEYTDPNGKIKRIGIWFEENKIVSIEGPRITPQCILDYLVENGFDISGL